MNFNKTKVMVSGSKGEALKSKVDPMCQVRQEGDGKWIHGRSAKMKRVTSALAKGFACKLCVDTKDGIVKPGKKCHFFTRLTL